MGNDRYTSPDLSRHLAEAGLEQNYSGDYWHRNPGLADDEDPWFTARWDDPECGDNSVRALRLDEVLEEILKLAPLSDWSVHTCDVGTACRVWRPCSDDDATTVPDFEDTSFDSPVEAAGLILLALLRERGGK